MNVIVITCNETINENASSTYMLELSNLWYGRLGHVNYDTLHKFINLGCIPKFNIDSNQKM